MGEIPEHLLKRAAERKAQLAAEAAGEDSSSPANAAADAADPVATAGESLPAPTATPPVEEEAPVRTGIAAKVPEFLFARSKTRRAVLSGAAPAPSGGARLVDGPER